MKPPRERREFPILRIFGHPVLLVSSRGNKKVKYKYEIKWKKNRRTLE